MTGSGTRIVVIPPIPLPRREADLRRRRYLSAARSETEIEIHPLRMGPPLTDREYELLWASLFMVLEAEEAQDGGAEGVLIDCTTDPGYVEMCQSLSIPVAGALHAGVAAAEIASRSGAAAVTGSATNSLSPFGIIALDDHWRLMIAARLKTFELERNLVGIETAGMHRYGLEKDDSSESENRSEQLFRNLVAAGRRLIETGARSIMLGSTTIITERKYLERELGVPVIDPGAAALSELEMVLSGDRPPPPETELNPVYRYGDTFRSSALWKSATRSFTDSL